MTKFFEHIAITGASSGIGAELARHYAAPGVTLSLVGRDRERLTEVAVFCENAGAAVHAALIDVTDREALAAFLLEQDREKPIDLLIANAGISAGTGGVLHGEPADQVRKIFDVNLTGVLNTINPVLPEMVGRGRGQIALMSSLAGFRGWPGAPAYCASKAAVRVYGESLRGALGKTGVGVSVICPGFVESRMTAVNDFPMPFLMGAPQAAKIIARGLANDRGRISFPLRAAAFVWFISLLPDRIAQKLLKATPPKKAQSDSNLS
ncbi:MAG TPA: short-chain dehydrogenase [Rhodospirillaceae bacterium]|nr:short-chain dehydrogenase [Rhodospirillaceae bacterium]